MSEELSRLLSGDLPPAHASALQQRIARDPELAAQWRAMSQLPGALSSLPDIPPPPGLDDRVLALRAHPRKASNVRRSWVAAAIALAAAILVAVASWPTPPSQVVVAAGSHLVEGDVRVLAGGTTVELDGVALITVEPGTAIEREGQQEDAMRNAILAAATGAAITVTVYEGSALLWPDARADQPIALSEGDSHAVPGPTRSRKAIRTSTPEQLASLSLAEATARISALEQQIEESKFESTLVKGQLEAFQGAAQAFPDNHPAAVGPSGFEESLRDALGDIEGVEVAVVDCDEFPCIAYIRPVGEFDRDWHRAPEQAIKGLGEEHYDGDVGVMAMVAMSEDDNGGPGSAELAIALMPGGSEDRDVQQRTSFRVRDRFEQTMHPEE
jgi:anti-sigma factor RsiW